MFHIDQNLFDKTFILGKEKRFQHKTNKHFNMFPFTGSTSDKTVDSFDNILGAFIRTLYSLDAPKEIDRDSIIKNICSNVECEGNSVLSLQSVIKELFFIDEHTIRCTSFNMFKYTPASKNEQKISEYLIRAICDENAIINALKDSQTANNILDLMVEEHLPMLQSMENKTNYLSLFPFIKQYFTKDLIFLIKDKNTDYNGIISLISYYYFFYTSQVILYLNKFCLGTTEITPVFFCVEWEKTSISRECFSRGWKQIDSKLKTMFSHAVLLEMLNQTSETEKKYCYSDILEEYKNATLEKQHMIFAEIEELKNNYTTKYIEQDGFTFEQGNYQANDIDSLIRGFFDDIMLQFEKDKTSRRRANEAYPNSFNAFCKSNLLKRFGRCGNMLALSEELLVLMTKIAIGDKKQVRLKELFGEFRNRGIYMDKQTQECVVNFYEKLNLIEKKSDSGDAQYVKGIL